MNDMFTLLLPKHTSYELRYYNAAGNLCKQSVTLGNEPLTVEVYLND
jgi:hypothetical protein